MNRRIAARAEQEMHSGNVAKGNQDMAKVKQLAKLQDQISEHVAKIESMSGLPHQHAAPPAPKAASFLQIKKGSSHSRRAPEDELAKEMTHDLEMNFNKIAPFGKEDTAKELQDHAAKTQDTL